MLHNKNCIFMLCIGIIGMTLLLGIGVVTKIFLYKDNQNAGNYHELLPDNSTEEPLAYINEDFTVAEGFHSNLPIVILSLDGEVPEYKSFSATGEENIIENTDPYTTGTVSVIRDENGNNDLSDNPVYYSQMRIKKRGHTSYSYDKSQYLIKTVNEDGTDNESDILDMGAGDSWILNGSMADKSMIRNYLAYRIASEIDGNMMSPDSEFCEVLINRDGTYEYVGVYLLMETVSRGESRIDIEQYKEKNVYSSYIVRRDRFTNFDVMLNTYGRMNNLSEQWIGLKYPSANKITEQTKQYIENDFSKTEQILYAEDETYFKIYDKYIDIDTFVDYFLINEYFGNYDAGEHSTYMYKNSGDLLNIGPVWDFDQAMNNYFAEEIKPAKLAFQTKPIFDRLTKDQRFLTELKERYSKLQRKELSEEHVFSVIDETTDYLKSARAREWYRWAADYEDGSFTNLHNYYLQDYMKNGVVISRFNDNYEQEIYNIKNYIHHHNTVIQEELSKLMKSAKYNSSIKNENELFLIMIMVLFLVPSFYINKKG